MLDPETAACITLKLHWFSQQVLDYYLLGRISTGEFLRFFHMPNSDYLPLGQCIVSHFRPDYVPGTLQPSVLDSYICQRPDCLT